MSRSDPTYIGEVASVTGGIVAVALREQDEMPSTLVMVDGESYRIGQIGAFFRVPLGYTQLYAVCTQVGAAAAPSQDSNGDVYGRRWMSISLFGESLGGYFEREVSQYPTVGDEVHLVTRNDLSIIYESRETGGTITVGNIAASTGIPARLDIGRLLTRHSFVVGSTGAGKSNFVAILLQALATQGFPSARIIVVDPHGEYPAALGAHSKVVKINPDGNSGQKPLDVPFWALPFEELREITLGGLQPHTESAVRDEIQRMKKHAAKHLKNPPPDETITADSPIPFNIKRLWFELDDFERQTFKEANQIAETRCDLIEEGDANSLKPNIYPAVDPYNKAPYRNKSKRSIVKTARINAKSSA